MYTVTVICTITLLHVNTGPRQTPGLLVTEVRGVKTAGMTFDAIIELITKKERPLSIKFAPEKAEDS
jgi:hypothetical protein